MMMKRILLGTTALLGAAVLVPADASAQAARTSVTPGGAFDLTISGFARFVVSGGDWQEKSGLAKASQGVDFSNDTEVNVIGKAKDEASGIEYGFKIEFEADTNATNNTDESGVYIKGGFGEFRLGDDDGPTDIFALGAQSVGVGTGGIDGTGVDVGRLVKLPNSGDATKATYLTPVMGGIQAGVSYTPSSGNNDGRQGVGAPVQDLNVGDVKDWLEAGVAYTGSFAGTSLKASVTGMWGQDESSERDADTYGLAGGVVFGLMGFNVGGSVGVSKLLDLETKYFNVGANYKFGTIGVSATYGKVFSGDVSEPSDLVLGAEVGLFPGVILSGEVAFFDMDRGGDDDGVLGVGRLAFVF